MPKKKTLSRLSSNRTSKKSYHKVTITLDDRAYKMYQQLENKRRFVHLAFYNAVGIMQWDIMRKGGYPEPKRPDYRKVIRTYNLKNPLPPRFKTKYARRPERQLSENSPPKQELW